jgi:hypothetical protein
MTKQPQSLKTRLGTIAGRTGRDAPQEELP